MADIINQNTGIPVNEVKTGTAGAVDPIINCSLEVALDPEEVAVFVRNGIKQCFNFTALKCCCNDNISITLKSSVNANFGTLDLNSSGVCFTPGASLGKPGWIDDAATFTATSTSANGCTLTVDFYVHFIFESSCRACCKCRKCN